MTPFDGLEIMIFAFSSPAIPAGNAAPLTSRIDKAKYILLVGDNFSLTVNFLDLQKDLDGPRRGKIAVRKPLQDYGTESKCGLGGATSPLPSVIAALRRGCGC